MAATFSAHAPGRLLLNVVTGGEAHEQRVLRRSSRQGGAVRPLRRIPLGRAALWAGERVTYPGEHLQIEDAALPTLPDPVPPLYFGGSSPAAGPVAATHSDVYLTWGEPVDAVAKKIEWIRGLAAERGRTVRFGIRLHVITRDRSEAAWGTAGRLVDALGEDVVAAAQEGLARSESTGQVAHARAAREAPRERVVARRALTRDRAESVGRCRPRARRRRDGTGRQPPRGGRPDRRVRRDRHRRIRAVRLPAPGGAVLVRRGRAPGAAPPRTVRHRRRPARRSTAARRSCRRWPAVRSRRTRSASSGPTTRCGRTHRGAGRRPSRRAR